jgi:dihydropteroate synthase
VPLYVSLSRKDFVGAVLAGSWEGRLPAGEREWGTVAAATLAVREGADVLRIHDRSTLQAVRVAGHIAGPGAFVTHNGKKAPEGEGSADG